jgi:hypothetical protein
MTTMKRNTKLSAVEVVEEARDLMKALMKEALQEVLEGKGCLETRATNNELDHYRLPSPIDKDMSIWA